MSTPAYDTIAALLSWPDYQPPSAQDTYDAIMSDRVCAWVFHRAVDWALYRMAEGRSLDAPGSGPHCSPAALDTLFETMAADVLSGRRHARDIPAADIVMAYWLHPVRRTPEEAEALLACARELDKIYAPRTVARRERRKAVAR